MPITAKLKAWAQQYFEEKLWKEHEGRLTQKAAVQLATWDRNMQRRTQTLEIRAADVTWVWVSQMKQLGMMSGLVYRPTLGTLGTFMPM